MSDNNSKSKDSMVKSSNNQEKDNINNSSKSNSIDNDLSVMLKNERLDLDFSADKFKSSN